MLVIDGDFERPRSAFEDMADRAGDGSSLMEILGDDLVDYEREAFATSGFGTWAPKQTGSGRTLVDQGTLLRALTERPDASGDTVKASGTEYAGYLRAGARGMPKRDPAPPPSSRYLNEWASDVLAFIVDGERS